MTFPFIPILTIDVFGSLLVVVFSVLSLNKARMLRKKDPYNFVYLYLSWICNGFVIFAISRSFGHILKQVLVLMNIHSEWERICPYTGAINTSAFMAVGIITLFFEQSWRINIKIFSNRKELEAAHEESLDLNQNLEQKVIRRTEQMINTEHRCRRVFEQSRDIILLTDIDFQVIETNPAGLALVGYTRDEMINDKPCISRFFASLDDWSRLKDLICANEFILNEEIEFVRSDGVNFSVIMTGGMDYGAFGGQTTYHFIIKNINDKRRLEKQMVQMEKLAALGELSAGVAHEINNPLGVILGFTQLMLKEESPDIPPEFYEDLKTIKKHVLTCTTVVSDLLTFSRKNSSEKGLLDINGLVTDVIKFVSNHMDFKEIEVLLDLSSEAELSVLGDVQEIRQVIINLVINAGHAVGEKGRIEVKTSKENGHIIIQVKDSGGGINKGDLMKIFDPFFTTKPVGQGTGLGLSVSYGIIQNHGGDITAKSNPGEETVFTVTLPAAI